MGGQEGIKGSRRRASEDMMHGAMTLCPQPLADLVREPGAVWRPRLLAGKVPDPAVSPGATQPGTGVPLGHRQVQRQWRGPGLVHSLFPHTAEVFGSVSVVKDTT